MLIDQQDIVNARHTHTQYTLYDPPDICYPAPITCEHTHKTGPIYVLTESQT
jgi:hypothetical protein